MRYRIRRLVHSSTLFALLAMAGMACLPAAAAKHNLEDDRAFDGTWRSRGYGWLWQINNGQVARFDIGNGFCIAKSPDEEDMIGPDSRAQLSEDRRTLRLLLEDPDYFYTFERLSELPTPCNQSSDASPVSVFDVVLEMFEAHYAFFEQRGIDWPQTVETSRANVTSTIDDVELFAVLEDLLAPFADTHVSIEAEIDGTKESISGTDERTPAEIDGEPVVSGAWSSQAAQELLGESARQRGDETLIYGLLGNEVGYLQVQSMAGMEASDLEAALDDAITAFDKAQAVIVDVSENYGGLDSFARRIARRFASEPTVAYSKYAGDFEGDRPQEIILHPPDRPRYLGPVFLITSHDTVSAAEVFTMSMRALPNVVHLGETTDGALSDQLWKTLPNGWRLSLSNEVYLDSDGVLWEGRGIPPEFPLAISEGDEITDNHEQSVRDLIDFIRKQLG